MKNIPPIILTLLCLAAPAAALADSATVPTEEEQRALWDSECRAELAPYGQGDLQGALLAKLNACINRKQNDKAIAEKTARERERLSLRDQREASRRLNILNRIRKGGELRIQSAMERRIGQGTTLESIKTPSRYEKVHRTLRGAEVPESTGQ